MGIRSKFVDGGVGGTSRNVISTLLEAAVRFLQFVFGIAVIGLYAQDVREANKNNAKMDRRWTYAVVISSISTLSALIYMLLPILLPRPPRLIPALHLPTFIYDTLLWILWLVVFGIFAKVFLPTDGKKYENNDDVKRMRHAVYVDLVNMLLWAGAALGLGIRWWKGRKNGSDGGGDQGLKDGAAPFDGEEAGYGYEVRQI